LIFPRKEKNMTPIWKDYVETLGDTPVSSKAYAVQDDDDISVDIFTGVAYTRPGQTIPQVRLNDIVAPMLKRGFTPAGETDRAYFYARIETDGGDWSSSEEFYADWSYDPDFNPATHGLNHPVLGTVMPGQLIPLTKSSAGTYHAAISLATGVEDFNPDFNRDFLIQGLDVADESLVIADDFGTAWLDLRDYPAATKVTVGGRTFLVGGGCHQFVLYYVNAYGGWDQLVVTARTTEQDALTRYNLQTDYNNATSARGTRTVAIELAHKYTFRTGYMDEAASLKMHHLLNSPHVWLHDVIANRFYPITLTNTATEYKKGGRLYRYDIEAQLAQERIRR